MRKFQSRLIYGFLIKYFIPGKLHDGNYCRVEISNAVQPIHTLKIPLQYDQRKRSHMGIPDLKGEDFLFVNKVTDRYILFLNLIQTNPLARQILDVLKNSAHHSFIFAYRKDFPSGANRALIVKHFLVTQGIQVHHQKTGTEFIGLNMIIHKTGITEPQKVMDVFKNLMDFGIIERAPLLIGEDKRLCHGYVLRGEWKEEGESPEHQYFLVRDFGKRWEIRGLLKLLPLVKTPRRRVKK